MSRFNLKLSWPSASKALLALGLTFGSTACLAHRDGNRVAFDESTEATLQTTCAEMAQVGDYVKVKERFDRKIAELLRLANRDPALTEERAEEVSKAIEKEAARLRELAKPEWNTELLPAVYEWDLKPWDFVFAPLPSAAFKIRDVQILGAKIYGHEATDYSLESFEKQKNGLYKVRIKVPGTAFEICELPKGLVFKVLVKYRVGEIRSRKIMYLSVGVGEEQ